MSKNSQNIKKSKGLITMIGAFLGAFAMYYTVVLFNGGKQPVFGSGLWPLLWIGAVVGAVIGFAFSRTQDKSSEANNNSATKASQIDSAKELMDFKKLLDDGVITQEEFDKKKQEILERK